MNIEEKFNVAGTIKYILQKLGHKFNLSGIKIDDLAKEKEQVLCGAIMDVLECKNISYERFWENTKKWPEEEERLFRKASTLVEFYESWNQESATMNICANILNQMLSVKNYSTYSYFANQSESIIDYGCGTATLSLGDMILHKKNNKRLTLLDVDNDIKNLVEFRIRKNNIQDNVVFNNVLTYKTNNKVDLIACFDVLEHLENSSEVFCSRIYPMLKKGGLIILNAPWRGQLTHIDKAADDFYHNGGRKFLSKYLHEVYRFGSNDISCVYKKIKE